MTLLRYGLLLAVLGCSREERDFDEPPSSPHRYDDQAYAISQGRRLFITMNCVGCHAQGGGGMGPALMDDRWIYGSDPEQIRYTIRKGRPNGMPSFENRLTDQQVWQLVAYVRTLGSLTENMARASRDDHMKVAPNQVLRQTTTPRDTSGNQP